MSRTLRSDKGQTIPLFLVAAMALLFLAFSLFAVGQAAAHRNSTQSASDAAALAAAQKAREKLEETLRRAVIAGDLTAVAEVLATTTIDAPEACAEAGRFARRNEAVLTSCIPLPAPPGYTVSVISRKPLGKSNIEGTENKRARTDATAVIEPRCSLGAGAEKPPAPINFDCDEGALSIDPGNPDLEIDITKFFSVRLRG